MGAVGQTQKFQYDLNNNPVSATDPNNNETTKTYDALDRLIQSVDPMHSASHFSYDAQGNLEYVEDPRGIATRYQHDGLSNLTQLHSQDTGTHTYQYDAAGNTVQKTDARDVVTVYAYDALNRLTAQRILSDAGSNIDYRYDDTSLGNNGIGRLTAIKDTRGETSFTYDVHGNLKSQIQTIVAEDFNSLDSVHFEYDSAHQVVKIDYPKNISLLYERDEAGKVRQIGFQKENIPLRHIASEINYRPFGPLQSLTWGNKVILDRQYDQDYKLLSQKIGTAHASEFQRDKNGNIIQHQSDATRVRTLNYDSLNRLTEEKTTDYQQNFSYDLTGNRTRKSVHFFADGELVNEATTYQLDATSNRLLAIDNHALLMDETGNQLNDQKQRRYSYDGQNRLSSVADQDSLLAQYIYNALGQRILKTTPTNITKFIYGPDGLLLGEVLYDRQGNTLKTQYYFWLDNLLLGGISTEYDLKEMETGSTIFYMHSDHLDTPRIATNADNKILWHWDADAFGVGKASGSLTINLRFPGQYYDDESENHYNYFRDHDPATGRYLQSDPIGLAGGINTYVYAGSNPLIYFDRFGLKVVFDEGAPGIDMLKSDYEALKTTEHGAKICGQLEARPETYTITTAGAGNAAWYNGEKWALRIDPNFRPIIDTTEGRMRSDPLSVMGHEIGHAATKIFNEMQNITANENPIRKELGLPPRTTHEVYKQL